LRSYAHSLLTLFTHGDQSETIYSTTTVDVTQSDATTIDYWALVPSTDRWLHTTRDVVIEGAANDNAPIVATSSPPTTANDNNPATTTTVTSTP
jgi:hypothetical protein